MKDYKKAINLALITALISGLANFVNKFAVTAVGDALVFTTIKNLAVGMIIAAWLLLRTGAKELRWKQISKQNWVRLGLIALVGGSLPFYLFFKGLMLTAAINASLIHKTLIFWVAGLAGWKLKEKISSQQLLALGLIFGSNWLIGGFQGMAWGRGESLILLATILWAVENLIAKQVLQQVATEIVLGARMILGSVLLVLAVGLSGGWDLISQLSFGIWALLLISAVLLFGYVLSWYQALRLAPVTLVTTILTLATLVTNILSSIFVTQSLNFGLIFQSILLLIGVQIFVKKGRRDLPVSFPQRASSITAGGRRGSP
jgi:drug/metabolite transporter (DMT)-like permease